MNNIVISAFRKLKGGHLFIISLLIVFFAGCEGCEPTVVDEPAVNLDAKVTVLDTEKSPSDGKVPVFIQFFLAGKYVKLIDTASVSCNGVALPYTALGYGARVPLKSPGTAYIIQHKRSGVTTGITIITPTRPVFVNPKEGNTVVKSSSLTITYIAGSGSAVRASAGDGKTGLGGNEQPDNGSYTGFDVSKLISGPGTIGLTRIIKQTIPGTGFKSAASTYNVGSDINVLWH